MFVSSAYAQAAGAGPGGAFDVMQFLPLILIFVVFYFLLIRPQQKKAREHRSMLDALRRGDRVVTGGGIVGTVVKVAADDEVMVEIAEGVRVRVLKPTIQAVMARTEPARGGGKTAEQPTAANADAPEAGTPTTTSAPVGGATGSPLGGISRLFGRK